jgi:glycosyltransferase involved in cell wall biosynthesis
MTSRIPQVPPPVRAVTETSRPVWSVMIPTYNCTVYLKQTLESVLIQDPGPEKMQIEVVDDCSTDGDVEKLVLEVGKGRISFFKQEQNRGSLRNFETCLNRSKGHYVHLLHGDDMIMNGYYKEMEHLFARFPEIGAAYCNYTYIDDKGNISEPGTPLLDQEGVIPQFLDQIATKQMLQVVAMTVKRSVYEQLGSFFAVHYGEDWEMWIRIAANYLVAYTPNCLALYRGGQGHTASITSSYLMNGQNIRDINRVIEIAQEYLPKDKKSQLKRQAKKNYSSHYAKASHKLYQYNPQAAFIQAKGALKMHLNIRTLYWYLKLNLLHTQSLLFKKQFKKGKDILAIEK